MHSVFLFLIFFTSAGCQKALNYIFTVPLCSSLFLQLPEYQLSCNLFLLSVGGTLHFFLSMAFREGHLTVALMVFCLEKFSGPKGIGYYNNGAEVLASATLCFSLSLLLALMASLEGAREYQVGSPGTEVAALLLFLF